jgi:uncharacterized protein
MDYVYIHKLYTMNNPFPALNRQNYMALTTFRKNGQAVVTPVWFAQEGDKLYLFSGATAGKVKRITHTARVMAAPCTMGGTLLGDAVEANARILQTAEERRMADRALTRKYGWQKRLLFFWYRLRGEKDSDNAYLEISIGN